MPTLPLFDRSAASGAWHRVTAPGGYEGWAFDAEDPTSDTQISVVFTAGAQQHRPYLAAFERYRRSPTTTPPPLPDDYAGVVLQVYRGGTLLHRSFTPGRLSSSTASQEVTVGASRFDGASRVEVEAGDARVELDFTPGFVPPSGGRHVLQFMRKSHHEWTLVAPRCTITGTITLAGQRMPFAGVGSCEHVFGTATVCYALARLIRGRFFTADGVAVFHIASHRLRTHKPEALLLHASPAGVTEVAAASIARTHVDRISFGEELVLTSPRIIDAHTHGTRVVFDAECRGRRGAAHCDVFYPQSPRQPFIEAAKQWLLPND